MAFRLSPAAQSDIEGIAAHIAGDDPEAAGRWIADIERRCRRLGDMPGKGVARPDIRPGLRLLAAGNYLILHRHIAEGVEIIRVLHGARSWQGLA